MCKVSYDIFIKMLEELNDFIINKYDPNYIMDVRAIGGFSMIIHKKLGNIDGPRMESSDIDSLTKDYPDEIVKEIKIIGEKYGATDADGWLNNHWNRTKKYNEEFEYFIKWSKLEDIVLSNINVYYADLESLFMFKIRAIDDRINFAHLEPREQDVIDITSILRAFKIKNIDNIDNELIKNTMQYFPFAVNYLIENNILKGHKVSTNNIDNKKFDETEYGKKLAEYIKEYNKIKNKNNIVDNQLKIFVNEINKESFNGNGQEVISTSEEIVEDNSNELNKTVEENSNETPKGGDEEDGSDEPNF